VGKGYSASSNLAVESKELPVGPGVVGVYVSFGYVRLGCAVVRLYRVLVVVDCTAKTTRL
jgi:hypothetical protein